VWIKTKDTGHSGLPGVLRGITVIVNEENKELA